MDVFNINPVRINAAKRAARFKDAIASEELEEVGPIKERIRQKILEESTEVKEKLYPDLKKTLIKLGIDPSRAREIVVSKEHEKKPISHSPFEFGYETYTGNWPEYLAEGEFEEDPTTPSEFERDFTSDELADLLGEPVVEEEEKPKKEKTDWEKMTSVQKKIFITDKVLKKEPLLDFEERYFDKEMKNKIYEGPELSGISKEFLGEEKEPLPGKIVSPWVVKKIKPNRYHEIVMDTGDVFYIHSLDFSRGANVLTEQKDERSILDRANLYMREIKPGPVDAFPKKGEDEAVVDFRKRISNELSKRIRKSLIENFPKLKPADITATVKPTEMVEKILKKKVFGLGKSVIKKVDQIKRNRNSKLIDKEKSKVNRKVLELNMLIDDINRIRKKDLYKNRKFIGKSLHKLIKSGGMSMDEVMGWLKDRDLDKRVHIFPYFKSLFKEEKIIVKHS